jgi:hypothetical protein
MKENEIKSGKKRKSGELLEMMRTHQLVLIARSFFNVATELEIM